jgi:hypothetical protein
MSSETPGKLATDSSNTETANVGRPYRGPWSADCRWCTTGALHTENDHVSSETTGKRPSNSSEREAVVTWAREACEWLRRVHPDGLPLSSANDIEIGRITN